jgi:hypothetical protein
MDKNIACVNPFFSILTNTLMSMLKHVHKKEIERKCKEGQVLKDNTAKVGHKRDINNESNPNKSSKAKHL